MQSDISVGMAKQAHAMRYLDAAEGDVIAGAKSMHVKAIADPEVRKARRSQLLLGASQIISGGDFHVGVRALDQMDGNTRTLRDGGIIGQGQSCRSAMRGQNVLETEGLWRLRAP